MAYLRPGRTGRGLLGRKSKHFNGWWGKVNILHPKRYIRYIMAFSFSNLCVQVTLPSSLPGRLAQHQRHCLCDPQLYGRTVAAIPG
jgi:hypothetical protein